MAKLKIDREAESAMLERELEQRGFGYLSFCTRSRHPSDHLPGRRRETGESCTPHQGHRPILYPEYGRSSWTMGSNALSRYPR